MRKRIKQILRESEFDWVGQSEGTEFRRWIHRQLEEYSIRDNTIDELEKFMADLPTDDLEPFIWTIQTLADEAFESGKEVGYDDGYDNGRGDGYNDGYDDGQSDKDCYDECDDICSEKWDDGYDTGSNDGYNRGHSEGYDEGQDECEECD